MMRYLWWSKVTCKFSWVTSVLSIMLLNLIECGMAGQVLWKQMCVQTGMGRHDKIGWKTLAIAIVDLGGPV